MSLALLFRRLCLCGLAGLLLLSAVTAARAEGEQVEAVTYYVSSSGGSDSNDGRSNAAPFASIAKVNALALQPGDRVLFKCGDQWRGTPLVISRSGASGQNIVFGAYPTNCANRPILSGAQPVRGWSLHGGSIYVADLSAGSNAGRFGFGVNQLFRGPQRLPNGRWPNLDQPDGGYAGIESQPATNRFSDAQLPPGDWSGAIAHIRAMRWYILNRQVTASSGGVLTVGSALACWGGDCTGWGYFLNNHLLTLDQEGEWFYDAAANRLYLFSAAPPADAEIEASIILQNDNRAWGGVMLGRDLTGAGVSYITVENLDIRRWYRHGVASPTNLKNSENHHLTLRNNRIQDVDSAGLSLATWVYDANSGSDGWRGGYSLTIHNNQIERANRIGIDSYARSSTISNNLIRDIALIENLGAAGMGCALDAGEGACTEDGDGIRIKVDKPAANGNNLIVRNNRLERIGYNGIDVFGHSNLFSQNVIIQACYSKGDCGGVRTFGRDNLSATPVYDLTFSENIIVDTIGNTDGCRADFDTLFGFGLYIDNYSRNVAIQANTIISSTSHGVLLQASTGAVSDNVLYHNARAGGAQVRLTGSPAQISDHNGNVLFSLHSAARTLHLSDPARLAASDGNFFFNPWQAQHILTAGAARTLASWRSFSGKDGGSSEDWYSQADGEAARSRIWYNPGAAPLTVALGTTLYKDLNQVETLGQIELAPYRSQVLVKVQELADLELTLNLLAGATVQAGAPLSYTLTVRNLGSAAAAGVQLSHLLPAGVSALSWQSSAGGVTQQPGPAFTWSLPNLGAGKSLTLTVQAQYAAGLPPGAPLRLQAEVSTGTREFSLLNNPAEIRLGEWNIRRYLPLVQR